MELTAKHTGVFWVRQPTHSNHTTALAPHRQEHHPHLVSAKSFCEPCRSFRQTWRAEKDIGTSNRPTENIVRNPSKPTRQGPSGRRNPPVQKPPRVFNTHHRHTYMQNLEEHGSHVWFDGCVRRFGRTSQTSVL